MAQMQISERLDRFDRRIDSLAEAVANRTADVKYLRQHIEEIFEKFAEMTTDKAKPNSGVKIKMKISFEGPGDRADQSNIIRAICAFLVANYGIPVEYCDPDSEDENEVFESHRDDVCSEDFPISECHGVIVVHT